MQVFYVTFLSFIVTACLGFPFDSDGNRPHLVARKRDARSGNSLTLTKKEGGMGNAMNLVFGNSCRTDDPDPVTGLTSCDKHLVKTSWARLMKTPADTGVLLLSKFFEKYPQYLQLFPFRDLPPSEFQTNNRFRAHATRVVYGLAAIVDALNDNDLLIQLLTTVGTAHAPRHVTPEGFDHLKEVTLELFSTIFKPDEVQAWTKTLNVAFSVIKKGVESVKS